ncbi:MAG TPA: L-aspartate oxidase [Acidisarcina sp.]
MGTPHATPQETDYLIVGAGIAGLRAAITLAESGRVLVITKEALDESNTHYAQGGIAVAMGGEEDISLHFDDTLNAGDGLVDAEAAAILVEEGPLRVEELLAWGTGFDRENGELMLTREGAHSRSRILHAHGDATGAEIGRALLAKAKSIPNITLVEWTTCVDLVLSHDDPTEVIGLAVLNPLGEIEHIRARAVLLASGGAGQVYSDTTNPAVATGDGIAAAWRAGADISDMEFYQFHPTALSLPGVPRFLLSEALRGEGAYLRNASGERFMHRYHPLLELAPRDVVARAITREGLAPPTDQNPGIPLPVYLDMRHVRGIDLNKRFPGISGFLHRHNLDLSRDLIPVRPAAHYLMGGIRTGTDARASLRRLYAAGEAACTGVHGANRLASNSLLEGLVFGARAAQSMCAESSLSPPSPFQPPGMRVPRVSTSRHRSSPNPTLFPQLRKLMWEKAGLLRDADGLHAAQIGLDEMADQLSEVTDRASLELNNLHAIATLITQSAVAREESRGAHYRNDYPTRNDRDLQRHSLVQGRLAVTFGELSNAAEIQAATR